MLITFLKCFKNPANQPNLEEVLQTLAESSLSCHDTAKIPEAVFHAFVLGLLANFRGAYEIRSSSEFGFGRAGIVMRLFKPSIFPTAYVVEFKSVKSKSMLKAALDEAAAQIAAVGVKLEDIRKIAVAISQKHVKVSLL